MKFHYSLFIITLMFFQQSLSAAEYEARISLADVRQLGLPVSGVVESVYVSAGSYVKKGKKMLSLDCGLYRAQLRQSQALVNGIKPAVETALKEKELADELFARTVLSEIEHRQAELAYIKEKSKHDAAQARTEEIQWQSKNCDLVADSDLMVLEVHINKGQLFNLKSDNPLLLTVASKKVMQVNSELTLPLKQSFKINQPVKVKVDGRQFDAKLSSISYHSNSTVVIAARVEVFEPLLMSAKSAKLIIK